MPPPSSPSFLPAREESITANSNRQAMAPNQRPPFVFAAATMLSSSSSSSSGAPAVEGWERNGDGSGSKVMKRFGSGRSCSTRQFPSSSSPPPPRHSSPPSSPRLHLVAPSPRRRPPALRFLMHLPPWRFLLVLLLLALSFSEVSRCRRCVVATLTTTTTKNLHPQIGSGPTAPLRPATQQLVALPHPRCPRETTDDDDDVTAKGKRSRGGVGSSCSGSLWLLQLSWGGWRCAGFQGGRRRVLVTTRAAAVVITTGILIAVITTTTTTALALHC